MPSKSNSNDDPTTSSSKGAENDTNKNNDSMMDVDDETNTGNSNNNNDNDEDDDEAMQDVDDDDDDDDGEDDDDDDEDDFHFKWLDNGHRRNGRKEYDSVFLTLHGTSFKVTKKDFILLWGLHGEEQEKEDDIMNQTIEDIWLSAGCAQVESMWEERDSNVDGGEPKAMFQARWFFQVCTTRVMFS